MKITMFMFFLMSICNTFAQDSTHLNYIIPDFQVNENAGTKGSRQENSDIAMDYEGNFVATWVDERGGVPEIYAQMYSKEDLPIGNNFKVSDNTTYELIHPCIAMDSSGNFVIAWLCYKSIYDEQKNESYSLYNIYAQFYSYTGERFGDNFKVNDEGDANWLSAPDITINDDGHIVVVWSENMEDQGSVYAQHFYNWSRSGNNLIISNNGLKPNVSILSDSSFLATWIDDSLIVAQVFSMEGTKLSDNISVNDIILSENEYFTEVKIISNYVGGFYIAWNKALTAWISESTKNTIYCQKVTTEGELIGKNVKLTEFHNPATWTRRFDIANDSNDNLILTWAKTENNQEFGATIIMSQRYSSDGSKIGPEYWINESSSSNDYICFDPAIALSEQGDFIISWIDNKNLDFDIFAQHFTKEDQFLNSSFEITKDEGSSDESQPSFIIDRNGNFVIVWTDGRNDDGDIYGQRFSKEGEFLGNNFRINDDNTFTRQRNPQIACDSSGNFAVIWYDNRTDETPIYMQMYTNQGTPIGNNVKVSVSQTNGSYLSIGMHKSGDFVVVWSKENIYAQRFSNKGVKMGSIFKVNEQMMLGTYKPTVKYDNNGNFIIAWVTMSGNADYHKNHIFAQRYSNDGSPINNNFEVVSSENDVFYNQPDIFIEDNGDFKIFWSSSAEFKLSVQNYFSNGDINGERLTSDLSSKKYIENISLGFDNSGNFICIWSEFDDYTSNIYCQKFDNNFNKIGQVFTISNSNNQFSVRSTPRVSLCNNQIYNVLAENRSGNTGYNIYANVIDWNNPTITSIDEKGKTEIPTKFTLFQNYPNPFNPSTTIKYSIPRQSHVTLKVYDILGREVAALVNEEKPAGNYQVEFSAKGGSAYGGNAANLPSGIFFYRIQAGSFNQVRKMILLK